MDSLRFVSRLSRRVRSNCIARRGLCSVSYDDRLEGVEKKTVTLIPGDGVGPELCAAVRHVFTSLGVPVEWDEVNIPDLFFC